MVHFYTFFVATVSWVRKIIQGIIVASSFYIVIEDRKLVEVIYVA